jgi:hypothetical protein
MKQDANTVKELVAAVRAAIAAAEAATSAVNAATAALASINAAKSADTSAASGSDLQLCDDSPLKTACPRSSKRRGSRGITPRNW